ncbi:MAG: hypothetical protein QF898_07980 [SAR202 cluster bacterium]|jgi:hypothetical protein|nr:hypothetical protein [SAR202 cluster bacterium]MDP6512979.1 hypothetical protein [SAR202 cluster bacterium]MDP6713099.1 hypothetical protein [SAR202 cluster bacterium]
MSNTEDSKTSQAGPGNLVITLDSGNLQVSYVSSMLRVLQAAVRDVARSVDDARDLFEGQPQPVLLLSTEVDGPDLNLHIFFADPNNSTPMLDVSAQAFDPFMVKFGNLLKLLPQPGLWGRMARRSGPSHIETETDRRLDELRVELRHFTKATLRFGDRSIAFDGDQLVIE